MPRTPSAALSLSLPSSDYPHGSRIAVLPATNAEADTLLRSAHRSSFKSLHRLDSLGWLQAAIWHFKTGKGGFKRDHQTIFGYGINVFKNKKAASRAVRDVRIHTRKFRVAHLYSRLYQSSDAQETLRFVFFAYHDVEVEAYYEYDGVAPATLAKSLRHVFSRESSHLAHLSRLFSRLLNRKPGRSTSTATVVEAPFSTLTATPATPLGTPTSAPETASPTPTATMVPTAQIRYTTPTATSIALPTATAASVPSYTPTAIPAVTGSPGATATPPAGVTVQASMASPSYAPGAMAIVNLYVTKGDQPEAGAKIQANFFFPGSIGTCTAVTDTTGRASCGAFVPVAPNGTQVPVSVQVIGPLNEYGVGSTSFVIQRA